MTMLNVNFDTNALKLDVVDEAVKLGTNVYPVLIAAPPTALTIRHKPWGRTQ